MTHTLLEMLTYRRPAGSRMERQFRKRYLLNLPGAYLDVYGNLHVSVGESRTLWSCHTDTVHMQGGRQRIVYSDGIARLAQTNRGAGCLGADDTVGVYLLREMIRAGRPGVYVFHFGEERGGIGSSAIARSHADYLRKNFDHAIALDRRGTTDVITHMCVGRTCSTAFAQSLADQLNRAGLHYAPSDRGSYTDTAEYTDHVPECTNLAIGYQGEHSPLEMVDVEHVERLRDALLTLDTSALTIARDPSKPDPDYVSFTKSWPAFDRWDRWMDEDDRWTTSTERDDKQSETTEDLVDYYERLIRDAEARYPAAPDAAQETK